MGLTAPSHKAERRDPSARVSVLLDVEEPGPDLVRRSVYIGILAVLAAFWGTVAYLAWTLVA